MVGMGFIFRIIFFLDNRMGYIMYLGVFKVVFYGEWIVYIFIIFNSIVSCNFLLVVSKML